jgi:hypothetical protein
MSEWSEQSDKSGYCTNNIQDITSKSVHKFFDNGKKYPPIKEQPVSGVICDEEPCAPVSGVICDNADNTQCIPIKKKPVSGVICDEDKKVNDTQSCIGPYMCGSPPKTQLTNNITPSSSPVKKQKTRDPIYQVFSQSDSV